MRDKREERKGKVKRLDVREREREGKGWDFVKKREKSEVFWKFLVNVLFF